MAVDIALFSSQKQKKAAVTDKDAAVNVDTKNAGTFRFKTAAAPTKAAGMS